MRPVLFKIGKLSIPGYGFMIAIGFVAAIIVGEYRAKKKGLDSEAIIDLAIIAILTGFLGAKILYILISFREFLESPGDFLKTSGFVVYGGIISGVLCCMLYCRIKKLKFLDYFDIVMPEVAIAQGFGRIGCFLGGCCYGIESSFGFTVHNNQLLPSVNDVQRFPVQLLESLLNLILFFVLAHLLKKGLLKGKLFATYLLSYSVIRFFDEFLRGDTYRGFLLGLSTSQIISIVIFICSIIYLIYQGKKNNTHNKTHL